MYDLEMCLTHDNYRTRAFIQPPPFFLNTIYPHNRLYTCTFSLLVRETPSNCGEILLHNDGKTMQKARTCTNITLYFKLCLWQ